MSHRALGNQFHVYRGIHGKSSLEDLQNGIGLGQHWTDVRDIASQFSTQTGEVGSYGGYRSPWSREGIIIKAVASKDDILDDPEELEDIGAYPGDQDEAEVPLKTGSKVKVKSVTHQSLDSTRRRITRFNPPKEMTV